MTGKYHEVEFKYRATITLEQFRKLCLLNNPTNYIQAAGFDRFFESKKDPEAFCRHRVEPGKFNQLTFKRKLTDGNNYIRTEHNLSLAIDTTDDQIEALCAEFGYLYNTSIYKSCFVYNFSNYTLVYYICFDTNLNELGRFIEIEMSETQFNGRSDLAWEALRELEDRFKEALSVSTQSRIKRSLFEMFRK